MQGFHTGTRELLSCTAECKNKWSAKSPAVVKELIDSEVRKWYVLGPFLRPPEVEINIENPLLSPHETINDINLDSQLDDNQKTELNEILRSYSDVLTDVPGRTTAIEHDIILKTEVPIRKKVYMLLYALREKVGSAVAQ